MKYSFTIQESHLESLKHLVLNAEGVEKPAILLCGISCIASDLWDGEPETRFLSKEIIQIPDSEIEEATAISVKWNTNIFRKALQKAEREKLALCLIHSHPHGIHKFSETDDREEMELFSTIYARNGQGVPHLSLVINYDGNLTARVCTTALNYRPINFIRIIGKRFVFLYPQKYKLVGKEEFDRQQIAFGPALNNDLSRLKIAVVGCGATGSATAHLLARLGVGQILLIDKDIVERTNLNRLYGSSAADSDAGKSKTAALKDFITSIGIGCRVKTIDNWVGAEEVRDALKSCDVVFGCTDDNAGRLYLNRFAHFYHTPVIDMGISIDLCDNGSEIIDAKGRVTVLVSGNPCLICRGLVSPRQAYEENLKRSDLKSYNKQKEEAYVIGSGNPSPAVITFTTEVASMSVNEFLNRLTGFKKSGIISNVIRFFDKGEDRHQGAKHREGCNICHVSKYWGKGDMEPYMDQSN